MRISRYIATVIFITALALLYVHQQVETLKMGYKLRQNQCNYLRLLDQNRILRYNVIALESPAALEVALLDSKGKFQMPEDWQVVSLSDRKSPLRTDRRHISKRPTKGLISFLKLDTEAEAGSRR